MDAPYKDILQNLSSARSFSHLEQEQLSQLTSMGRVETFAKGATILTEGTENHDIFFLLRGSVSVYSASRFVCRYGRIGDIFGEMSVVSESPVSATVITNEPTEAIVIDGTIVGSLRSAGEHELVTVFYKLFSLSLLEKLRLTTLKARVFEDAIRHAPLQTGTEADEYLERTVEKQLNDTLLTSLAVHTAEQAIVVTDAKGHVVRFNLAAENLFSLIELQVRGQSMRTLCDGDSFGSIYEKLLEGTLSSWSGELGFVRGGGKPFPARVSLSVIQDPDGQAIGLLSIITDISREKALEERLRQSQKLEAIGQLAAGMAHDFNNLLQIITGFSELALKAAERPERAAKMQRDLQMVLEAARRGTGLTQRLLSFGRRESAEKRPVILNTIIAGLSGLLETLVGERIEIRTVTSEALWPVRADLGQIEQALTNLCINARDAMPNGGTLTVACRNAEIDDVVYDRYVDTGSGGLIHYVQLSVSDTGVGIDEAQMAHIFEPFYTTKAAGEGTGLGLAIAQGVAQDHGGFLRVESQVGQGTTVHLYLPKSEALAEQVSSAGIRRGPGGHETILVAEDDHDIRTILRRLLSDAGYTVVTACDGNDAELRYAEHESAIDIVLLDAIMPGLNGKEVYRRLKEKRPKLPILMISGYAPEVVGDDFIESERIRLIQKPFSPDRLLWEVRSSLDKARESPAA